MPPGNTLLFISMNLASSKGRERGTNYKQLQQDCKSLQQLILICWVPSGIFHLVRKQNFM